jgi:hypothetical protein
MYFFQLSDSSEPSTLRSVTGTYTFLRMFLVMDHFSCPYSTTGFLIVHLSHDTKDFLNMFKYYSDREYLCICQVYTIFHILDNYVKKRKKQLVIMN